MIDRRRFVLGSLASGLAAAACTRESPKQPAPGPAPRPATEPPAKRSILILGGTGFLGPHVVAAARARGHAVTLFNRRKTHPDMFPDLETLQGDRDGKLEALRGRTWDAVVDTSGFVPRIVKMSAELLAPSVKHYVFISTISVYKDHAKVGFDETAPVATIADPTNEDSRANYGALKALCEQAAEAALPNRALNVRPGVIVGPGDPTGRFTHWVTRTADGGDVLAPGEGTTPVQWIDGRDLGAWIVQAIEDATVGVYNAIGPARRATIKELVDTCNAVGGNKSTITWVPAEFLAARDVAGWSDLPLWLPNTGEMAGFGTISNARAIAAGLTLRPLAETAKDTLAWVATLSADAAGDKARSSGIARDKEAKVLAAFRARK